MATFSTSAAIGVSDAGASTQSTGNVVVPSSAIVYALVVNSDATPLAPTGVTWDPSGANQAFTQLGTTLTISSFGRASLWRIITPTAGTAPVRASWSGNQTERTVIVWVGTNIDTTTPNETPVTATGTNTTPTATASTGIVSGDMVVSFGAYQHSITTARTFNSPTGGTNVNERQDTASSPDGYSGGAVMDAEATGTSISPQWTLSGAVDGWGIFVVPLNDGGVAVGRADETDTAFALTAFIPVPGRADEVDTAFALLPTNFADDGELFIFGDDSGFESSMGGLRVFGGFPAAGSSINVGRADETDTAFARGITLATGLASETDTALARTLTQSRAVGLSTETDTAFALASSQARAVGLSTETDTAFARGITLATGIATETDTAFALDLNAGLSVGTAVETDTAFALGVTLATGRANETDTASALTFSQSRAVGLATETDTALQLASSQSRAVGRADETDTALALTLGGPVSIDVGRADEVDTALALEVIGAIQESVRRGHAKARKRYYSVKIDDEEFIVATKEEAQALLNEAVKAARERAKQKAEPIKVLRGREKRQAVAEARSELRPPSITADLPGLEVSDAVAQITAAYQAAINEALRTAREREIEDDDEAVLLLLT